MSNPFPVKGEQAIIEAVDLQQLIDALVAQGFLVIGPQVREDAIVLDELKAATMLPSGWTDEQRPGSYRLIRGGGAEYFRFNAGPESWKKFLLPPVQGVWKAQHSDSKEGKADGLRISRQEIEPERFAFLGVRPCDLKAIEVQDRVLMQGAWVDPGYKSRRESAFIVAVNCTRAGANCFCTSMGHGPRAESGFDLALTEIVEGDRHYFLIEVGSGKGETILTQVVHTAASEENIKVARKLTNDAANQTGRRLDTNGLKETLYRSYDSAQWGRVATRCLSCANCTLVCPTCFCTTFEDVTDLTGEHAERWRKLDSCFNLEFSYIHGGSIRSSVASRYRQWLVHKLGTWVDQFGTFGCVGCGRCITWCPVGIDITEEARAVQELGGGAARRPEESASTPEDRRV